MKTRQTTASRLPRIPSVKGRFPFRLGTTSFILPDERIPNARLLAPLVDEIELLFFESRRPDSLPQPDEIAELAKIGREEDLRYNVHLPLDLYLGDADNAVRAHGLEAAKQCIARTAPLQPTCWVLHLDWLRPDKSPARDQNAWLRRLRDSLAELLRAGVAAQTLAVENLLYPFDRVAGLVRELDMRFCLDIGHLLLFENDPADFFQRFLPHTIMLHIHGVRNGKDHASLKHLDAAAVRMLCDRLAPYTQGVSIEVFNARDLSESLAQLMEWKLCGGKEKEPSL